MARALLEMEVRDFRQSEQQLRQIDKAMRNLDQAHKKGRISSDRLEKSTAQLRRRQQQLRRELQLNTTQTGKMTMSMGSLSAAAAAVGVTFGAWQVTRIIGSAVRAAADFEAQMANVSTLINTQTPLGRRQLERLQHEILALDPALGSATELTQALYQALSAGTAPANAVRLVGDAALFAKAGLTSTFTSVDVLTTVLNAYGKEAKSVAEISDVLLQTVFEGKTNADLLASSLGAVIPIAAALKIPLTDIGAALATLTKQGQSTSEAVTGLRALLRTFVSPEAKKRLDELGVSAEEFRRILAEDGLNGALQVLRERLGGSQAATASLFREQEALLTALTLLGEGSEEFERILREVERAEREGGVTQEAFAKNTEFFNARVNELSASWERLLISFSSSGPATASVELLIGTVNKLTDVVDALKGVEFGGFGLFGAQFGANLIREVTGAAKEADLALGPAGLSGSAGKTTAALGPSGLGGAAPQAAGAVVRLSKELDISVGSFENATDAINAMLAAEKELAAFNAKVEFLTLPPEVLLARMNELADQLPPAFDAAGASIDNLGFALGRLPALAPPVIDSARDMQAAYERMASQIDSFFQQVFVTARSFKDVWQQLTQQMVRIFISGVGQMVARWLAGMRQMQAATSVGFGGGFLGTLGSILFGGSGAAVQAATGGASIAQVTSVADTGIFTPNIGQISAGAGITASEVTGAALTGLPAAGAGGVTASVLQGGASTGLLARAGGFGLPGLLLGGGLGLGGFGISAGSPLLGGIGGAATGFGLASLLGFAAFGPIGLIAAGIGAALGAIFGAFSHGKKKRQATEIALAMQAEFAKIVDSFKEFEIGFESAIASVTGVWEQAVSAFNQIGGKVGRRSISSQERHFTAALEEINALQKVREQRAALIGGLPIPEFHFGGFVNDFSQLINWADGTLLARLKVGESILTQRGTQTLGRSNIEQLNRGGIPAAGTVVDIHPGAIVVNPAPGMDERALAQFAVAEFKRELRGRGVRL